jgi:hypothetical protein
LAFFGSRFEAARDDAANVWGNAQNQVPSPPYCELKRIHINHLISLIFTPDSFSDMKSDYETLAF